MIQSDDALTALYAANAELERKIDSLAEAVAAILEDAATRQSPSVWAYDASFPIDAENVYEAEYWDNRVKRWIGPEPDLNIKPRLRARRSYILSANIPDFVSQDAADGFGIRVNGVAITIKKGAPNIYEGTFYVEHDGFQDIALFTHVARSPAELSGSKDRRVLSFSIASIIIAEVK
jgi:hypothetical protein